MLKLEVVYRCKPGQREAFHKELCAIGAREISIHEKGNHKYDYYFDAQDPDALLLLELWDDDACLAAHSATENMARIKQLKAIYCESSTIDRLEI